MKYERIKVFPKKILVNILRKNKEIQKLILKSKFTNIIKYIIQFLFISDTLKKSVRKEFNKNFKQNLRIEEYVSEKLSYKEIPLWILFLVWVIPFFISYLFRILRIPNLSLDNNYFLIAGILAGVSTILITILVFSLEMRRTEVPGLERLFQLFIYHLGFLPVAAFLIGTLLSLLTAGFLYNCRLNIFNMLILQTVIYGEVLYSLILLFKLLINTVHSLGEWTNQSASLLARDFDKNLKFNIMYILQESLACLILGVKAIKIGYDISPDYYLKDLIFYRYGKGEVLKLKGPGKIKNVNLKCFKKIFKIIRGINSVQNEKKEISLIANPKQYYIHDEIPLMKIEKFEYKELDSLEFILSKAFKVRVDDRRNDLLKELENFSGRLKWYIEKQSKDAIQITIDSYRKIFEIYLDTLDKIIKLKENYKKSVELRTNTTAIYHLNESCFNNDFYNNLKLENIDLNRILEKTIISESNQINIYILDYFLVNLCLLSFEKDNKNYYGNSISYFYIFLEKNYEINPKNANFLKNYIINLFDTLSARFNTHMLTSDFSRLISLVDIKYIEDFEVIYLSILLKVIKIIFDRRNEKFFIKFFKSIIKTIRADDENMNIKRYEEACENPKDKSIWRNTPYKDNDPIENFKMLEAYLRLKDFQKLAILFIGAWIAFKLRLSIDALWLWRKFLINISDIITGHIEINNLSNASDHGFYSTDNLKDLIELYFFWEPWNIGGSKDIKLKVHKWFESSSDAHFIFIFWLSCSLKCISYLKHESRRLNEEEFKFLRNKDNFKAGYDYLINHLNDINEGYSRKLKWYLDDLDIDRAKKDLIEILDYINLQVS